MNNPRLIRKTKPNRKRYLDSRFIMEFLGEDCNPANDALYDYLFALKCHINNIATVLSPLQKKLLVCCEYLKSLEATHNQCAKCK